MCNLLVIEGLLKSRHTLLVEMIRFEKIRKDEQIKESQRTVL